MQHAITLGGTLLVILLVAGIIAFLIVFNHRHWKYKKEKLSLQKQFEQSLLQTQIEIQSQTLKTISQEIHDNVGQVLSLAKLNLGTILVDESFQNQKKLEDTRNLVGKAISDLRDLSRSLYGNKIAELGLAEAIENEMAILQNSGNFNTQVVESGQRFRLDPQKEMIIFRMFQEGLQNAIKHSKAANISVRLSYQPEEFNLKIEDDGVGFDQQNLSESNSGMGLLSLAQRAALIQAIFSLHSAEDKGTEINISLRQSIAETQKIYG